MKLLFDQNLSPRLVRSLADLVPGSADVSDLGLETASVDELWTYARDYGYLIVSNDSDFSDYRTLRGTPPRIVWVRTGNCTTAEIESLLRAHQSAIAHLSADPNIGILSLS